MQTLSDPRGRAEGTDRLRHEETQTLHTLASRTKLAERIQFAFCMLVLAIVVIAWPGSAQRTDAAPARHAPTHQLIFQQSDEQAQHLMLDEPVQDLPVVDDARWSSRWTDSTPVAVFVWIALLVVLSLAGRPLARVVFDAFPDAGQGFSRLIVLLVSGWAVWFVASYELIEFRVVWAWYAVIATAVIGWLLSRKRLLVPSPETSRRAIWGAEGAFWIVFAIFLILRFFNPDSWHPIWGGEKPMEFAHINALLRTPYFPPFDPWFSGGILNYYYYGEYLVAFLIKLTGIPSEIAFNLAQPTMLGFAASGMYSVVVAVSTRLSRDRVDPLVAGALGVVIFCLSGNLVAAWDLFRALPDRPAFTFDWTWAASRAIDGGITEFPYFTGLYADLHAHLIALPITILVIGLGFALATSKESLAVNLPKLIGLALGLGALSAANFWDVPVYAVLLPAAIFLWSAKYGGLIVRCLVTIVLSGATGALAYLMFRPFHQHFIALFNERGRVTSGTDLGQFTLHLGGLLGIIGIATAASGLLSWSGANRRWRNVAVVVFCLSVSIAIAWQILRPALDAFESGSAETIALSLIAAGVLAMVLLRAQADAYLAAVAVVFGVAGTAYLVSLGWPVLAIGLILAAAGALVYFSFSDQDTSYFGLLVAAAGSLIAGVELVYVVDDLTSTEWYRMNTIFKLYYQIWTLLSIMAAVAFVVLLSKRSKQITTWVQTARGFAPETELMPAPRSRSAQFGIAACAVLIALSLVYPAVATLPRIDQRFEGHPGPGTLDALDWMRYGTLTSANGQVIRFDGDLEAMEWFQQNVDGTPVIAEASIGPYRGDGSRFSIALGLPAVLGWDRHEQQQRFYAEIAARDIDVRDLYNSPEVERKREIIARYGIEYIIVGDVERRSALPAIPSELYASAQGIAAFEQMVGTDLEVAFDRDGTTVYRVVRPDDPV